MFAADPFERDFTIGHHLQVVIVALEAADQPIESARVGLNDGRARARHGTWADGLRAAYGNLFTTL